MTILIFFLVLFVLVLVHEWGHFIVAKKTGMRVDEFGIGFPPKIFSWKKGETEYTFNLFPIGGFVKIFGEDGANAPSSPVGTEGADDRSEPVRGEAGRGGTKSAMLVAGENEQPKYAAGTKLDNSVAVDYSRSFSARPKWAQLAVLFAGVVMNILFAWFLFFLVLTIGVPTGVEESEAGPSAELIVSGVLEDGPAAEAGIPRSAIITELSAGEDRDVILNPTSFRAFTEDHADVDMTIGYRVGDEAFETSLRAEVGIVEDDPDRPAIGVALSLVETKRTPFYIAWWDAALMTVTSLGAITVGILSLFGDAIVGQADFTQVAGPIGIVGMVGEAAEFGFTSLLLFTAFISLNLAVINLLPIPALDGGRILFVLIEAVTRRPINPVWAYRMNAFGFLLLILLMLAVTFSDITKLI